MVIKNPDASEYIEPLKKLFPKGEYWDRLLSDPASDVSLVCAARAESLAAFKMRMNQLLRESLPDFADETIGDWERIYFGYENGGGWNWGRDGRFCGYSVPAASTSAY